MLIDFFRDQRVRGLEGFTFTMGDASELDAWVNAIVRLHAPSIVLPDVMSFDLSKAPLSDVVRLAIEKMLLRQTYPADFEILYLTASGEAGRMTARTVRDNPPPLSELEQMLLHPIPFPSLAVVNPDVPPPPPYAAALSNSVAFDTQLLGAISLHMEEGYADTVESPALERKPSADELSAEADEEASRPLFFKYRVARRGPRAKTERQNPRYVRFKDRFQKSGDQSFANYLRNFSAIPEDENEDNDDEEHESDTHTQGQHTQLKKR